MILTDKNNSRKVEIHSLQYLWYLKFYFDQVSLNRIEKNYKEKREWYLVEWGNSQYENIIIEGI